MRIEDMLRELNLPYWVLLVPIFNISIISIWLFENIHIKLDPIIHWRSYRRAEQAISPGGNHTTGWYYRMIPPINPVFCSARIMPDGTKVSFNELFQYDGCSIDSKGITYFHFKENDFGWQHESENTVRRWLESGRMIPIDAAPLDLEVMRFVINEGIRM